MKDIVENRKRLSLSSKLKLALLAFRENGLLWFLYMSVYYVGSSLSNFGFSGADTLRKKKGLPGLNSLAGNKFIWENWDWSGGGEEWTPSAAWKASVVKNFIDPHFSNRDAILEVGPGAGRWSEYLIPKAGAYLGVDISEACVAECRKRFAASRNARFEVGNGRDLGSVKDGSIDGIFSCDVFVHINGREFESYVSEFSRVLKHGGVGVVHHGSSGGTGGGHRSDVTTAQVREYIARHRLELVEQIDSWMDQGEQHQAGLYSDVITIFRKA